eukprot:5456357-Lingulodinium_polyedra.AAC.1
MMTEIGEVMMYGGQPKTKSDIGWILPICRLQDELGTAVEYQSDGKNYCAARRWTKARDEAVPGLN